MPLRVARLLAACVWLVLAVPNGYSLREGLLYLGQWSAWRPAAVRPVSPDGPFGACYALAAQDNAGRHAFLLSELCAAGLAPIEVPVPEGGPPNLLVPLSPRGPYTLFVAHYDKDPDAPAFEAASDNTAAVAVLLAAARALAHEPPTRPVALLFAAAEERGLLGSRAFLAWAQATDWPIAEVINLDMLGRGRVALRPAGDAGLHFWLPGPGRLVYDGRGVGRATAYLPPDPRLKAELRGLMGRDLTVWRRVVANTDAVVFQAAGLPTVTLSSSDVYYMHLVWSRDADRVALLDEAHLALALDLVLGHTYQEPRGREP
ncbi:MAG: M20/M25/M40 family metallo-hydrolase [Chloroflexota bacterium]